MTAFSLKEQYYTTLDFTVLKSKIKSRIGLNYKLGIIDNGQINVYYLNDLYTQNGWDRVPFCQIRIKNQKQADGRLKILFGIADFILVLMALLPLILLAVVYFDVGPVPWYFVLVAYALEYLACKYFYSKQSFKFERDLKSLEAQ